VGKVSLAIVLSLHVTMPVARAQDTRTMQFTLGAVENDLDVRIEYLDPSVVDPRLGGSLVLPVSFEVRNISSRPITFDAKDVRLNLGGNRPLSPVTPEAAAGEIKRMNRVPGFLGFLGSQSSAFQPNQLAVRLQTRSLKDGNIQPGKTKKGFLFFIKPAAPDSVASSAVVWLETAHHRPQMLETKGISVWTRPAERMDLRTRIGQTLKGLIGTTPSFNKSYALLIGIEKYRNLPRLSSPGQDVDRMASYLQQQGFDEVVSIKDEYVTQDTLRQPEKYLQIKLGRDDRFLFYYSGHGLSIADGVRTRGYLPLIDEAMGDHGKSIPMDDLVEWMKGLSAQHLLVILDSCFSGLAIGGIEQKGFKLNDPKIDQEELQRLSRGPARYLLMAGTERQESFGGRMWNGSLFTDTLLKGMQSGADLFHDGIVTTRGLYVYLQRVVPVEAQKAGRELTPLLMDLNFNGVSQGEFIFVP